MTAEKIYHVETKEDYDALMIELESKGYTWSSGKKLSEFNRWVTNEENTYVRISENGVTFGDARFLFIGDCNCNFETYKAPQVEVNPMPTTEQEAYKVLANVFPDTAQGIFTNLLTFYANGSRVDNADDRMDALRYSLEALPKKAPIPKVVADWIKYCKLNGDLSDCLNGYIQTGFGRKRMEHEDEFHDWVDGDYDKLAELWLSDNYEVEKEKLYTVELNERVGLLKLSNGVKLSNSYNAWKNRLNRNLTEQEIKDFDERYWAFAKEVTE